MSYQAPNYVDKAFGPNQVRLAGSFSVNGVTIDSTSIRGKGITGVSRSGAGTYVVALSSSYLSVIAAVASCSTGSYFMNVPSDAVASATAPSVTLSLYVTGSGVSDPGVATRIHFDLVLATDPANK